jgi:acetylornithine deacetylase/succinyl-diaminopimelate desuccinylase-like protein
MIFRSVVAASSAVMLSLPGLHLGGAAAPPMPPPAVQAEARDMLAELVGINSTHNMGTMEAAKAVVARLKSAGFTDADIQLLAPPEHPTQANVVVRLKGTGQDRPILFECHLDVVEAKAEDWSMPPFKLTEKDGYFYGRGAIDMKDEDVAVLSALMRLKREGFKPDRDIIVVFTADEEGGDANGVEWLMKTHKDLVDAEFAINAEDGGGLIQGGQRLGYGVQTSEKTYVTYQMETTSPGGHSSRPEPDNAIYRLAEGLVRLEKLEFPLHMNDTTRGYFKAQASRQTGQLRDDMLAVSRPDPDPAAVARLTADPRWKPYLRTTCVATMAQAGHAENALPQRAAATIQCRMMPGDTQADVQLRIEQVIGDPRTAVTVIAPAEESGESVAQPGMMRRITDVVHDMWPGVDVFPTMDVGASDALYSRAANVPTFGVSGMWGDVDDNRAHGRDERVSVPAFYEDVEFNYRLMKSLSRAT